MKAAAIPEPVVADALGELDQYLSDRLAPLMIAEAMTVLARVPVDRVARQVHGWAEAQRAASGLPLADYLFHALRKVQIVGEFRLLPPSLFSSFFASLQKGVLALTPADQRGLLAADLAKLGQTDTRSVEQVERLHRPAGTNEGQAPAPRAEEPEPPRGGKLRLWAGLTLPEATLRRLNLLFDTLGQLAPSVPAKRRAALAADAFATASSGASSPAEMDAQLQQFSASGIVAHTYEAFRMLGESLPGWWAPGLSDPSQTGPQIQAMRRMITLTSDRQETSRRFHEMVENAIEQFNAGAVGRAVRMFDLALGMLQRGEVEPETVEALRAKGHHSLDPERLGELLGAGDRQGFPRVVLRFFRAFDPEELLDELAGESRRDKRLRLLALLEAHGDEGRRRAFERLTRTPYDTRDYYLFRNLVHLLRKIPRSVNTTWELEHEIARVIRCLVPDSPAFLIKEIVSFLTLTHHRVAEQALVLFVDALDSALANKASESEQGQWRAALDTTCAALAGWPSPRAWAAVVEHGLKGDARLGDPLARLAELGCQDLSEAPSLNARVTSAAFAELPADGRTASEPQLERLHHFVRALKATRSSEAHAFLEILALRCSRAPVGREASDVLRGVSASAPSDTGGGFAGDLDVFGLPALLHTLADLRQSGTLTIMDAEGQKAATVRYEKGRLAGARFGELASVSAFYALLERLFPGRFSFVPDHGQPSPNFEPAEVLPLLLEGLRRQDELRRLEALVPRDALLLAKVKGSPPAVAGETDSALLSTLWEAVNGGAAAGDCERLAAVDSYRVWATLASWLESGAIAIALA
jgi:hypothetical protein